MARHAKELIAEATDSQPGQQSTARAPPRMRDNGKQPRHSQNILPDTLQESDSCACAPSSSRTIALLTTVHCYGSIADTSEG